MSILFRIKRGLRANLPTLSEGEPGYTTDEKKLYIGTSTGNVELAKAQDVPTTTAMNTALAAKADKTETTNALNGKQNKPKSWVATLSTSWTAVTGGFQQDVTLTGIPADSTSTVTRIGVEDAYLDEYGKCGVRCRAQAANKLTFFALKKPGVLLKANVTVEEVSPQ